MSNRESPMVAPIQVFVVDAQPVLQFALKQLLADSGQFAWAGSAATPAEATEKFNEGATPDAVITELLFPQGSGLTLLQDLRSRFPRCKARSIPPWKASRTLSAPCIAARAVTSLSGAIQKPSSTLCNAFARATSFSTLIWPPSCFCDNCQIRANRSTGSASRSSAFSSSSPRG